VLRFCLFVCILAVISFWTTSHVIPNRLGQCQEVPVSFVKALLQQEAPTLEGRVEQFLEGLPTPRPEPPPRQEG
jgi:hypothetical protein